MIGEYLIHCLEQLEYDLSSSPLQSDSLGDFDPSFGERKNPLERETEDFSLQDSYIKIWQERGSPQPKRKSGEKVLFDVFGTEDYDVIGGIFRNNDKYNRR